MTQDNIITDKPISCFWPRCVSFVHIMLKHFHYQFCCCGRQVEGHAGCAGLHWGSMTHSMSSFPTHTTSSLSGHMKFEVVVLTFPLTMKLTQASPSCSAISCILPMKHLYLIAIHSLMVIESFLVLHRYISHSLTTHGSLTWPASK